MNDFIAWFGDHSLIIFGASGILLIVLLLLRRLKIEDAFERNADSYSENKTEEYIKKNPDATDAEIEAYKNKVRSQRKTLLSIPFATLSFLGILTLILSMIMIWQDQKGEDDITTSIIGKWLMEHGLVILAIALVAYILTSMLELFLPKMIRQFMDGRRNRSGNITSDVEFEKRGKTMARVLVTTVNAIIWVLAIFVILGNVGLDITPLLASAGVVGIAISLGAQNLIKDIFAGFFILLEGHYNVGDVVTISGITGTVTDINFRRTTLRGTDGVRYSIPNGQITISANATSEFSRVCFKVPVSYDSDIDLVETTINKVGMAIATDRRFKAYIKTPIKFIRIDNFGDSSLDILVSGETVPGQQWAIAGEFRRQLKAAFDKVGVEIPYAHIKVIVDEPDNGVSEEQQ